jgi:hypothetical protein
MLNCKADKASTQAAADANGAVPWPLGMRFELKEAHYRAQLEFKSAGAALIFRWQIVLSQR